MDIQLIAVLYLEEAKPVGVRLLDLDDGTIKDVGIHQVVTVLTSKKLEIKGLKVCGNKLEGANGGLHRYPKIIGDTIVGKSPLTIIDQIIDGEDTVGYTVVDYKGKIVRVKVNEVVAYAKNNGISNGKVVNMGGKEIISSIQGSYTRRQLDEFIKDSGDKDNDFKKWISIEEFKEYMDKNNYYYKINNVRGKIRLKILDDEIEVYRIPVGVHVVVKGIIGDNIKKLYIPSSVELIDDSLLSRLNKLEVIEYQEGTNRISIDGLPGENKLKHIEIPKSVTKVNNLPIWGDGVDLSNTNIERISNSFNGVGKKANNVLEYLKLPPKVKYISNSFGDITYTKGKVEIPSTLIGMVESFAVSDIAEIDFSNAVNLKSLGYNSIRYNDIVKRLDLSTTKIGIIGSGALYGCKEIEELILPDCLTEIKDSVASRCSKLSGVKFPQGLGEIGINVLYLSKQKVFNIPDSVHCVGLNSEDDESTIIFDGERKVISEGLLASRNMPRRIILNDNVKIIAAEALKNSSISYIDMGKGVELLGKECLSVTLKLEELDLRNNTNIKEIEDRAFKLSSIKKLVLPDSLRVLGKCVIEDCSNLAHVYLPKGISKLVASSIKGSGRSVAFGTTFYVYEGSKAHKLCDKNGYKFAFINSIDDFDKIIAEEEVERELDENKKAKFKLVLSGSNDRLESEIVSEEHINNADILLKLKNGLQNKFDDTGHEIKLNTDKFIDIDLSKAGKLKAGYDKFVLNYIEKFTTNNMFNSLSNLITSTYEIMPEVFSDNFIEVMEKTCDFGSNSYKVIYADPEKAIVTFRMSGNTMPKAYLKGEVYGLCYKITLIVIDGRVKFVSVSVSESYYVDNMIKLLPRGNYRLKDEEDYVTEPMINYIQDNSSIHAGTGASIINGTELPIYMEGLIFKKVLSQWIIIDYEITKLTFYSRSRGIGKATFMCTITGQIIETQVGFNWHAEKMIRANELFSIDIKARYKGLERLTEEKFERVKNNVFYKLDSRELVEKFSDEEKYLNKIKCLKGAYDDEINLACYEYELAKAMTLNGLMEKEDINLNLFHAIGATNFFVKTTKDFNSIIDNKLEVTECNDGEHILIEFNTKGARRDKEVYNCDNLRFGMALLKKGQKSGRVTAYVSGITLTSIMDILKNSIPTNISNKCDWRIVNGPIDIECYNEIANLSTIRLSNGGYCHLKLAMNKYHGNISLIGNFYLVGVTGGFKDVLLLNFKGLAEASVLANNEELMKFIRRDVRKLVIGVLNDENVDTTETGIVKVRDLIKSGYPNGYYIGGEDQQVYDLCLKQRV